MKTKKAKHIWKVTFDYLYCNSPCPKAVLVSTQTDSIAGAHANANIYLQDREEDFPDSHIKQISYIGETVA